MSRTQTFDIMLSGKNFFFLQLKIINYFINCNLKNRICQWKEKKTTKKNKALLLNWNLINHKTGWTKSVWIC